MACMLSRKAITVGRAGSAHAGLLLAAALDTAKPGDKIAIVVGADDTVNPQAQEDADSPIAGMPVLEVWKGETTVVLKRGMAAGYAGVDNPLFIKENTRMLFGDARDSLEALSRLI